MSYVYMNEYVNITILLIIHTSVLWNIHDIIYCSVLESTRWISLHYVTMLWPTFCLCRYFCFSRYASNVHKTTTTITTLEHWKCIIFIILRTLTCVCVYHIPIDVYVAARPYLRSILNVIHVHAGLSYIKSVLTSDWSLVYLQNITDRTYIWLHEIQIRYLHCVQWN